MIIILIILNIFIAIFGIIKFYKDPMDFGGIFILLYSVFYSLPMFDFLMDGKLFEKSIFGIYFQPDFQSLILAVQVTIVMIFFVLGYELAYRYNKKKIDYRNNIPTQGLNQFKVSKNKFWILITLALILWSIVFFLSLRNYGFNLILFFSPSRKEEVFESTYIINLYKNLPILISSAFIIRNYLTKQKLTPITFMYLLFPFLASLTSGQRREIINLVVFFAIFLIDINSQTIEKKHGKKKEQNYKRKQILFLGLSGIILVPALWWSRVLFTQIQNSNRIVNPFEIRGFSELLFGSSSGGFFTLILGDLHQELYQIPYLYSLIFFGTSFIPRSIFPNKPLIINRLWQLDLGLSGNPSIFYVNEVIINFGIFGFIFSFFFGVVLALIYSKNRNMTRFSGRLISYAILSNIITLFKNGFVQFFISIVMMTILVIIPLNFFLKRSKNET